jgi:hypothetical protein
VPAVPPPSPLNVPDTSTLPIALPQVSLPLEVPELPKLP